MENVVSEVLQSMWAHVAIWFGSMWAVMVFIRKVTKDADDELDDERRSLIVSQLLHMRAKGPGNWVPNFTRIFDRFFGEKHISWRCFFLSSVVSVCAFVILFSLIFGTDVIFEEISGGFAIVFLVMPLVFNAPLDYLSLLETRLLLNARFSTALKLAIDCMLTVSLFLLFVPISMALLSLIMGQDNYWDIRFLPVFIEEVVDLMAAPDSEVNQETRDLLYVVLITTFSTSFWLWLHGLSELSIRGLRAFNKIIAWLNVSERPLRAIGTTINIFVAIIGLALFPVYLLFS